MLANQKTEYFKEGVQQLKAQYKHFTASLTGIK